MIARDERTGQRLMGSNGAGSINDGLYRDAARNPPWGSTAGANTASRVGTTVQNFEVYGSRANPEVDRHERTDNHGPE
jgi:spore coat protein U-like protein